MLLLPAGPINLPLFPWCHTVLSAQRSQQLMPSQLCSAQRWPSQNSFTPPPLFLSLVTLLLTHSAKIPYTAPPVASGFHPASQHAIYAGCDWWLVVHPSLNLKSIPSKHFFLPFFLSSLVSPQNHECTPCLRLEEIPSLYVFMTESKGRVEGHPWERNYEAHTGLHAQ